jgi:aldehyde dehydrogenase (NAD+)
MDFLKRLGIKADNPGTSTGSTHFFTASATRIESYSPIDNSLIGSVYATTKDEYEKVVSASQEAFLRPGE